MSFRRSAGTGLYGTSYAPKTVVGGTGVGDTKYGSSRGLGYSSSFTSPSSYNSHLSNLSSSSYSNYGSNYNQRYTPSLNSYSSSRLRTLGRSNSLTRQRDRSKERTKDASRYSSSVYGSIRDSIRPSRDAIKYREYDAYSYIHSLPLKTLDKYKIKSTSPEKDVYDDFKKDKSNVGRDYLAGDAESDSLEASSLPRGILKNLKKAKESSKKGVEDVAKAETKSKKHKSKKPKPPSTPVPDRKATKQLPLSDYESDIDDDSSSLQLEEGDYHNSGEQETGSSLNKLGSPRAINRSHSVGRENGEKDYKKLYEEQLAENDKLQERLRGQEKELKLAKDTIENNTKTSSARSMLAESERREKRALERKLSEMEEELRELDQLRQENQRLRDENGALIRVISKLSR